MNINKMIEKSADVYTILKIDIIKGFLNGIDNKMLSSIALSHVDHHLNSEVEDTHYEDTFFPNCLEVDSISLQLIDTFEHVYPNISLELNDYWAHVHKPNMSTNTHSHCPDGISAVYYVNVNEKSGKICFECQPSLDISPIDNCFDPVENMFLIFPGYLSHRVTRNLSIEDRISLSFNFNIKQKI